ncbi:MAG: DUF4410 domain-containing protein [Bacteroidales bacterium]|nr:DUF4410 domain-containing protein [Bacteroidales bacterium]
MKKFVFTFLGCIVFIGSIFAQNSGTEYRDWEKWLDYINITRTVNLYEYSTLYITKVDDSKITYPDKNDNRYPALVKTMALFNIVIEKKIQKEFSHIKIVQIENAKDLTLDAKSLLLEPEMTELDMGSQALRFWIGFGAGAQHMVVSGKVSDSQGECFHFRHKRISSKSGGYEGTMIIEMNNFGADIAKIFKKMYKK